MDSQPDFQKFHADWIFHRLYHRYLERPDSEAKRVAIRWMRRAIEYYGWHDRERFVQLLDKRRAF